MDSWSLARHCECSVPLSDNRILQKTTKIENKRVFELVLNTSNIHFQQLDIQYAARRTSFHQLDPL
jgi:hypothetical protein